MTVTSILKTVVNIYCATIIFNTAAPESVTHETITASSKALPTMVKAHAKMSPTAPPEDRGSGR